MPTLTGTQTKRCSKCKKTKPLEEFSRHQKGKYGRHPECKVCRAVHQASRSFPPTPPMLDNLTLVKVCDGCDGLVRVADFHVKKGRRGGRDSRCKTCRSAYTASRSFPPTPPMLGHLTLVKICRGCGDLVRVSDFTAHKYSRDGRRPHCKACQTGYYLANRDQLRERSAAWYSENTDKMREWRRSERGKAVARRSHHKRRALKGRLPHEPYTLEQITVRDGDACWMCGKVTADSDREIEHLIAMATDPAELERWGIEHPGDTFANVSVACGSCNRAKGNRFMLCAAARFLRNAASDDLAMAS